MTEENKTILEKLKETLIAINDNNTGDLEEHLFKISQSFLACSTIATVAINMSALLYVVAAQYKGVEINSDIIDALSGFDRNGRNDDHLKNNLIVFLREWLNRDAYYDDLTCGCWCFLPEMMAAWEEIMRPKTSGELEVKT